MQVPFDQFQSLLSRSRLLSEAELQTVDQHLSTGRNRRLALPGHGIPGARRVVSKEEEGGLSRRDYLLIGIGAALGVPGVLLAGGLGWLIARWLNNG